MRYYVLETEKVIRLAASWPQLQQRCCCVEEKMLILDIETTCETDQKMVIVVESIHETESEMLLIGQGVLAALVEIAALQPCYIQFNKLTGGMVVEFGNPQ